MDLRAYAKESLDMACKMYCDDLDALSEEQLGASPMGKARTPYDFTYEVKVVNDRMANDIRGVENGPWPFGESWATAPDDVRSKEAIKSTLKESIEGVKAALDSVSDEELVAPIERENRPPTNKFRIANFCAYHTGYHCAQLNYIQSLHGDDEVHWDF